METIVPSTTNALQALLQADYRTQWRNRRALILVLFVPVVILVSWKGLIDKLGGAFVLSNCITIGLNSIGLMGYANSLARDRDKGVFQRLRVAPAPTWCIMTSRLLVQLSLILMVTVVVFIAGYYFDKIVVTPAGYVAALCAAIVGGAVYLALGQVIVGLVKNAETVNAVSRLVYFVFIMVGMFGELGLLGKVVTDIVIWSPYGVVRRIVSDALTAGNWNIKSTYSLLAAVGYILLFATLGIKWFKWSSR